MNLFGGLKGEGYLWGVIKNNNTMFEKITKGKASTIDSDVYMSDNNLLCFCAEDRNESEENAKFIAYCFNLQQKYDIGYMEKAVEILNSNSELLNLFASKCGNTGISEPRTLSEPDGTVCNCLNPHHAYTTIKLK